MNRTTLAQHRAEQGGPTPEQARRLERRALLQAFVASPEWKMVEAGLRANRRRTMENLAMNGMLSEQSMRDHQARYALLSALITAPVEYLTQFNDDEGGE